MAMSIGIDYIPGIWKICLLENGQVVELQQFSQGDEALSYVEQVCILYPEPIIALSSSIDTTLRSLASLDGEASEETEDLQRFLEGIRFLNSRAYHLPSVKHLSSIPRYRKRKNKAMGDAGDVGSVATLLYRMRQQEAVWPEMRFLLLEVGERGRRIVIVKDGRIVDGIANNEETANDFEEDVTEEEREQAFWEELSQEVAGLMATHHFEDIVLADAPGSEADQRRRDEAINRLGEMYQFYHYPHDTSEAQGFESAIGAALVAEGLYRPGLAAEVVERLQVKPS